MATTDRRAISTTRGVLVALLAGLVVFVLQFQWGGGNADDAPRCFGMFGAWTVPCGGWPAAAQGAVVAGLVWLLLRWKPWGPLLAGVVVFVLLFPWSGGIDTSPPTCGGLFGLFWTVPCGGVPALAAGALVAGVGWLALWGWNRHT